MNIDTKKSFKFIFDDKNWVPKILIGGAFYAVSSIFSSILNFSQNMTQVIQQSSTSGSNFYYMCAFVPMAIILTVISILLSSVPNGYIIQSIHNEIKDDGPLLPEWEGTFKQYFKQGLIFYGISFIYTSAILAIIFIPMIIFSVISHVGPAFAFISGPLIVIMWLLCALLFLGYGFIYPFIKSTYAENFNFKEAFNLSAIFKKISNVTSDYILTILLSFAVIIAFFVLSVLLVCTCVGILLVPFLSLPFSLIVFNMFAQLYKKAEVEKIEEPEQIEE